MSYPREEGHTEYLPELKVRLRPSVGKSGVSNECLLQLPPGLVVSQILLIHNPGTHAETELLLQAQNVIRLPGGGRVYYYSLLFSQHCENVAKFR